MTDLWRQFSSSPTHTLHLAHWVEISLWSPPRVCVSMCLCLCVFIVAPRTHTAWFRPPSHTLHFYFIRPYLSANTTTVFMNQLPRWIILEFRRECCCFGSSAVYLGITGGCIEISWGCCSLEKWMVSKRIYTVWKLTGNKKILRPHIEAYYFFTLHKQNNTTQWFWV